MIIVRRPGQAVFLGDYRLELTSTGGRFARWTLTVPTEIPVRKGDTLLAPCRTRSKLFFGLDPGEAVWIDDRIAVELRHCSSQHATLSVTAPRQILVLRQELLTSATPYQYARR